jgi:hypothetical protein
MKHISIAVLSLLLPASTALAADMPMKEPPPPVPIMGKAPIGKAPIGKSPVGKYPIAVRG